MLRSAEGDHTAAFTQADSRTILGNTADKIKNNWQSRRPEMKGRDRQTETDHSSQCHHSCIKVKVWHEVFDNGCNHPPPPPAGIPSPRGAVTVDGGIVTSWGEKGASPCSRSRWSYHGSSSSVTNSSILPARSIEAEELLLLLLLLLLHRRCDLLIHRLAPPEVTPNNSGAASPRVSPLETNSFTAPAVHLRLHPSADVEQ